MLIRSLIPSYNPALQALQYAGGKRLKNHCFKDSLLYLSVFFAGYTLYCYSDIILNMPKFWFMKSVCVDNPCDSQSAQNGCF